MTDPVLLERPSQRVAHVVLNRPERRNALIGPLVMETHVGRQRRRLDQRLVLARARRMLQHGLQGWPQVAGPGGAGQTN